jgi:arylsulfatase A-like enzyme/Flp pilus assembly protein TadD
VTIDTLRADRVGAYGSRAGLTPAFNRLAGRGWLFEDVVAAVPLTLPSHATILSGLDPYHHGVRNNGTYKFPEFTPTLATILKARGHATAAFVSAVVLDRRYGLARGFDAYDDRIDRVTKGRSVLESERACDAVVENASVWIRAQKGPFFAWVHFYEPHAPYAPPSDLALRGRSAYDAEVAAADRCLGRLVAVAEASRPNRLLTAVTSDHGEGLGEHGESTHGLFLYQSTLRVPMVISGAGVAAGKRQAGVTRGADLMPTVLGILGIEVPAGLDGRNLVKDSGGREAYAESDYATGFGWAPVRAWRIGNLKLVDAPRPELYDLAADSGEVSDLSNSRRADVERMRGILKAALASEVKGTRLNAGGESEERLRSLGYVAASSRRADSGDPAMDPKDAAPLLRGFEQAMDAEARGDFHASARLLGELVRKDPANITFHRSLAAALRRARRMDEALRVLIAAEKLDLKSASLAHDRALVLDELGKRVQAIESEKRAIGLDPAFVEAHDHLATLYAADGRFDLAREAVETALRLDTNHARAWANRGNIARSLGHADEAERSYARALELSPDLAEALNGSGVLAVEGGQLDRAADLFARALAADASLHEARLNLAVTESQRGNVELAVALAREAAARSKDPALRTKARAFLSDLQSLLR